MYTLRRSDWMTLGIADRYGMHKAVYSLFPQQDDQPRDFLFCDKGGDFHQRKILILSQRRPLQPAAGELVTREIPPTFLQHQCYGFEIVLNPTRRDNGSGKIVPVRERPKLLEWIIEKAPCWGFDIDAEALQLLECEVVQFQKKGAQCTLGSAHFRGKLVVTDKSLFERSFTQGIGRAKGFGFGLLQIVPLIIN
jgi:CRISPR system Cascade subunit CasE